jgi:glycosyltransferase involved in cell wall biosynthesis
VKVFLLCSGLGIINRGYESFTRQCFDALSSCPEFELHLFKGAGPSSEKETALWNLFRQSNAGKWLGKITGRGSYFIEQLTFFLSLTPHLIRKKPDIIYFSDGNLGNLLWHWRRLTGQRYKLLFSNGGPLSPPFPRWDYVQQVAPAHYETARRAGVPDGKQCLLPYGFSAPANFNPVTSQKKNELRAQLRLPVDRWIVLSVGAINATHKRMDYVIREVAALNGPRPFLLMLGQQDDETPAVRRLADDLLGDKGYEIRTVPAEIIADYYSAADLFVLASLSEGLPRVIIEAALNALPCLVHDYSITRYALGASGFFIDCTHEGSLGEAIHSIFAEEPDAQTRQLRRQQIYDRFSWEGLRPQYVEMIQKCAMVMRWRQRNECSTI